MSRNEDFIIRQVPTSIQNLLRVFREREKDYNRNIFFDGKRIPINGETDLSLHVSASSSENLLDSLLAMLTIYNVSCSYGRLDSGEIAHRYLDWLRKVVVGERLIVLARETEDQKRLFNRTRELSPSSQPKYYRVPIKLPPEDVLASLPSEVREEVTRMYISYASMEISWSSLTKIVPIILDEDYYETGFIVSPSGVMDTLVASIVEFLTEGSTPELRPVLEFTAQGGYIFTFLPDSWRLAVLAPKIYAQTNGF